ncbi:ORF6N domain-containing protein [Dyadobacter subterraneus]|uniref:ORF6N domain-containing protein n=1 Tax=Dyadobacter subterraneus TaxID=2773304 RepID=UPI0034D95A32
MKRSIETPCDRFPDDFMFEITRPECNSLRSQIVILENRKSCDLIIDFQYSI